MCCGKLFLHLLFTYLFSRSRVFTYWKYLLMNSLLFCLQVGDVDPSEVWFLLLLIFYELMIFDHHLYYNLFLLLNFHLMRALNAILWPALQWRALNALQWKWPKKLSQLLPLGHVMVYFKFIVFYRHACLFQQRLVELEFLWTGFFVLINA